jgi:hypothetical protein
MSLIQYLFLAHYLADFPLQGIYLATTKAKDIYSLLAHTLIYTLLICAVLDYFGQYDLWKLLFVFESHLVIDAWKCRYCSKKISDKVALLVDQVLHIAVLYIIVWWK